MTTIDDEDEEKKRIRRGFCSGFINERAAAAKAEAERLERERVETEIDRRPRHEAYLLKKTTTMSQDSMIFWSYIILIIFLNFLYKI